MATRMQGLKGEGARATERRCEPCDPVTASLVDGDQCGASAPYLGAVVAKNQEEFGLTDEGGRVEGSEKRLLAEAIEIPCNIFLARYCEAELHGTVEQS